MNYFKTILLYLCKKLLARGKKRFLLFIYLCCVTFTFAQSESVILAPQYIDLSASTSQSAILMHTNNYMDNTTKYRLYNGTSFYYCWDPDVDAYITNNSYSNNPLIPGDESTAIGSTWWILFQIGSNSNPTTTFGTRLSPYSSGYRTLSNAVNSTSLTNPFNLNGNVLAGGGYNLTVKYVVLGFDAITSGNLLCAASTDLTTGSYSLACHGGTTVKRIEFRTIDNVTITSVTNVGGWSSTTSVGSTPLPVELSYFLASNAQEGIKLNWRTETEVNNYGFEIERQAGSQQSSMKNWNKIGFLEGFGNSNSPKEYSFIDRNITNGNYLYRLKQIDNDGTFTYSNVVNICANTLLHYYLDQNYPNPFNPSTKIKFTVPEASRVTIKVINVLGQEVAVLINKMMKAGTHEVNFDGTGLIGGIYFYRIESGSFLSVKKMTLLK